MSETAARRLLTAATVLVMALALALTFAPAMRADAASAPAAVSPTGAAPQLQVAQAAQRVGDAPR